MGCLRNVFTGIGCITVVIVGAVVGYHFRAQLRGLVESVRGDAPRVVADSVSVGVPSSAALERAQRKERRMAAEGGPATVTLSADELASLVQAGFDPVGRGALDSVRVVLEFDRFALEALLRTSGLDRGLLGPLGGFVDATEPIRMAGPATITQPGWIGWRPDELVLRAFPFPEPLVSRLVAAILRTRDGVVPIAVPTTVGDLRIRADGVTFYRRAE
jgi:hypothetical protein